MCAAKLRDVTYRIVLHGNIIIIVIVDNIILYSYYYNNNGYHVTGLAVTVIRIRRNFEPEDVSTPTRQHVLHTLY